jgi:hypothetical protein
MAVTLYLLHVPHIPQHIIRSDCLTYLPVSNCFDNVLIVVDHFTRMAHFLPCTKSVTTKETATLILHGVYVLRGLPRVLVSDRSTRNLSVPSGKYFGDTSERGSTSLPVDTRSPGDGRPLQMNTDETRNLTLEIWRMVKPL